MPSSALMSDRPPPDHERQRALYRLRRIHLILLVIILIAALVLVVSRGVTPRGLGLVGVISAILAFRWWQLRKSRPRP